MKSFLSMAMLGCMLVTLRGNIWDTDLGKEVHSRTEFAEEFKSSKPPQATFREALEEKSSGGHSITTAKSVKNIDYSAWYTSMPSIKGERDNTVQISDITAYTTPPWDSTDDTYFFYQHKAKMDLYDYLTSRDIQAARGNQSSREFVEDHYLSYMNGWDRTGHRAIQGFTEHKTAYCNVDGVQCVFCGPMPAAIYKDYVSSGAWAKKSWPGSEWESRTKMCLVLVPKGKDREDSKNYIYLPAVSGSAKAHTYPWGVTQTHVSVTGENSIGAYTVGGGDYGKKYSLPANSADTIQYIAQTYNDGNGHHMLDYLYCGVELCYPGDDLYQKLHNYDFVGYLVYK